jgi:hypothetical protein
MTFFKPGLTFSVDFSLKTDDPLDPDFRHCRIEEGDGERLVRTFTGKVPRSQAARKHAKQDIARWCVARIATEMAVRLRTTPRNHPTVVL